MSYVLFSRTYEDDSATNVWTGAVGSDGIEAVTRVARSSFSEGSLVAGAIGWAQGESYLDGQLLTANGSSALYDLSNADATTTDASFNLALEAALAETGNVLDVASRFTVDGNTNNRTLDDDSGYRITSEDDTSGLASGLQILDFGLNDLNWNDIRFVELCVDSVDTGEGFDAISLRAFVDARVKIGDEAGVRSAAKFGASVAGSETFHLQIVNGKRGQIDASESDMAINAEIDVWADVASRTNSFSTVGSVFNDFLNIGFGSLAVSAGISKAGLGLGALVDATDTTFDSGEAGNQTSAYNGSGTRIYASLGAGDDVFNAVEGIQVIATGGGTATVTCELETTDMVWGGSGSDVIRAGGNNDFLFGDFGAVGEIRQDADPTTLVLELGADDDSFESWKVDGLVDRIWQQLRGQLNVNGDPLIRTATSSNWDQFFHVEEGYGGLPSVSGVGAGNSDGSATNNGANNANPEINAGAAGLDNGTADDDRLGFEFAKPIAAAEVDLGLFYADGGIETALVTIQDGGVELATYLVTAAGAISKVSGPATFALSLSGGGDVRTGGDAGESTLSIASTGGRTFDGLVFSTRGAVHSGSEVSDYYLKAIRLTVAPEEGNDTLDGGSGDDRIEGGGDRGSLILFQEAGDELLVNGGFETDAADAAPTGEGSYLTKGGAGFGWFAFGADPGNLEVWQDANGGIAAYEGSNKLELDSAPIDEANPIVRQNVATADGGLYELSFVFAERDGLGDGSSNFALNWSGVALGSFAKPGNAWTFVAQPDTGVEVTIIDEGAPGGWHRVTVTGLIGDGLNDFVQFRAAAAQTNLFGAFIDDVSLTAMRDAIGVEIGDRLTGGAGLDTFVWRKGDGVDLIEDFAFGAGGDMLDFDGDFVLTEIDLDFDHVLDSVIVHAAKGADEGVILKNVLDADLILAGPGADII